MTIRSKLIGASIFCAAALTIVGILTIVEFRYVDHAWRDYQDTVLSKREIILRMRSRMGYGGAIHHLKNYVLRGRPEYELRFWDDQQSVVAAIAEYGSHQGLSQKEIQSLNLLGEMVERYGNSMHMAKQIWTKGKSADEVYEKFRLLESLQAQMGYGGSIHHFKNYVIRGDYKYLQAFELSSSEINDVLIAYRELGNLSDNEQKSIALLLEMNEKYRSAIATAELHWREGQSADQAYRKVRLVEDLRAAIGYGGAIHSFKNYILRGGEVYLERYQNSTDRIERIISEYAQLTSVSNKERAALRSMQQMVEQYDDAIGTARTLWGQGKTADELFKKIRLVEDLRAQMGYGGAIHALKNYVLRGDVKYVHQYWQKSKNISSALAAYSEIGALSDNEREAVASVGEMIAEYDAAIEHAQRLEGMGHNSHEIDAKIQIEDGPYLSALTMLGGELQQARKSQESIDNQIRVDDTPYLEALDDLDDVLDIAHVVRKGIDSEVRVDDTPYLAAMSRLLGELENSTAVRRGIDANIKIDDRPYLLALTALSEELDEETELQTAALTQEMTRAMQLVVITSIIATLLVITAGLKVAYGLSGSIRQILGKAKGISEGDLSGEPLNVRSNDELGTLTSAINEMQGQLALRSEELIRQRDLAMAANNSKSEFLANMSHEIRTPMTAILGYSDILTEPTSSKDDKADAIETIQSNGQHLLQLINDVLDLSKIEAGRLETELVQFDLNHLMTEIVSLMKVRAESKNIRIQISYLGSIPRIVESDPMRLKQVLINLLGNAIKFTEQGSVELQISVHGDQASTLRLQVIDTGIGISSDKLEAIFEPFQQSDTSMTRKYGGTGLGLTITRRLIEMLNGTISIHSELGRGSEVTVNIPIAIQPGVQLIDQPQHRSGIIQKLPAITQTLDCRVLLVEDGKDNQRLITFVLRKAGANVTVAENGQLGADAALAAKARGEPFDVVLMDMQMPVMDGYEATAHLRHRDYDGPIIALTAHAMEGDRDKCMGMGCDDYVTKPIDKQKLISIVHHFASCAEGGNTQLVISELSRDADMVDIVHAFVGELPSKIRRIEQALAEQDQDRLKCLVRQLKGAEGYGFPIISEAAESTEQFMLQVRELDSLSVKISELIDLCKRARATEDTPA